MRIYIAGPMRGIPLYNWHAFHDAQIALEKMGHTVVNPHDLDSAEGFDVFDLPDGHDWSQMPEGMDFDEVMKRDIVAMKECDALVLLEGWQDSEGASMECDAWPPSKPHYFQAFGGSGFRSSMCGTLQPAERFSNFTAPPGGVDPPNTVAGKLPTDKDERKQTPIYSGLLRYFPDACAAVARLSYVANEQHNPGEPMHWAREKSTDHPDCLMRHLMEAGEIDTDGQRHTAKVAWRALAMLQTELEAAK